MNRLTKRETFMQSVQNQSQNTECWHFIAYSFAAIDGKIEAHRQRNVKLLSFTKTYQSTVEACIICDSKNICAFMNRQTCIVLLYKTTLSSSPNGYRATTSVSQQHSAGGNNLNRTFFSPCSVAKQKLLKLVANIAISCAYLELRNLNFDHFLESSRYKLINSHNIP